MASITMRRSGSGTLLLVFIFGLLLLGLLVFVTLAPPISQARPRAHPVEKHGYSAITAKMAVKYCDNLLVWFCPANPLLHHPPSFVYVCKEGGTNWCAGVVVGTQGTTLTAFTQSCDYWLGTAIRECVGTTIRSIKQVVVTVGGEYGTPGTGDK